MRCFQIRNLDESGTNLDEAGDERTPPRQPGSSSSTTPTTTTATTPTSTSIALESAMVERQQRSCERTGVLRTTTSSTGRKIGGEPSPPLDNIFSLRHNSLLHGCRSVDVYKRLNLIQEGAYGVVFRAKCKETGQIVALKQVKMGQV